MKSHTANFKNGLKEYGREFNEELYTYTTQITHLNGDSDNYLLKEEINSIKYYYDCDLLKSRMQTLVIDSLVNIPVGTKIQYKEGLKTKKFNFLF